MEEERQWYVVRSYCCYENQVKANLERKIQSMGMQTEIFQVLVPMEDEVEIKDGKRKVTKKKIFPGYVLVEMIVNDRTWYVVRNTPGVTGFVGSGSKAIPLSSLELKPILRAMGVEEPRQKIDVKPQEVIRIVAGAFENWTATVTDVYMDRGKIRALVNMFGRETPVELDFSQVEKL